LIGYHSEPFVYLILVCIWRAQVLKVTRRIQHHGFWINWYWKTVYFYFLFCLFCSGQILGIFSRPTSHRASNRRE